MTTSKKIKIKESAVIPSSIEETVKNGQRLFENDGQLTVDVYETDSNFVVLSTVAGIAVKDIEIMIDKDMLIIKGCRQNPEDEGRKNYFYQECYWGPFSRKIILPEDIDATRAQAEFNKGLLLIRFPKNLIKNKKELNIKES